jgi:hypothetical protein
LGVIFRKTLDLISFEFGITHMLGAKYLSREVQPCLMRNSCSSATFAEIVTSTARANMKATNYRAMETYSLAMRAGKKTGRGGHRISKKLSSLIWSGNAFQFLSATRRVFSREISRFLMPFEEGFAALSIILDRRV